MNGMDEVKRELKRIASVKSRLKKQKGKANYESEMQKVIAQENELKAMRDSISGGSKSVPQYTIEDVQSLSYDETIKAIKSIQSKKSLTKWLTDVEGDNDEYRNACKVEQMLRAHKETLQPSSVSLKENLQSIIDMQEELTKEEIIQKLQSLL